MDLSDFAPIEYADNENFNRYLDEIYTLEGGLSYSRALFDQDLVAYREQLRDFTAEREEQVE